MQGNALRRPHRQAPGGVGGADGDGGRAPQPGAQAR